MEIYIGQTVSWYEPKLTTHRFTSEMRQLRLSVAFCVSDRLCSSSCRSLEIISSSVAVDWLSRPAGPWVVTLAGIVSHSATSMEELCQRTGDCLELCLPSTKSYNGSSCTWSHTEHDSPRGLTQVVTIRNVHVTDKGWRDPVCKDICGQKLKKFYFCR